MSEERLTPVRATPEFQSPAVAACFDAFEAADRAALLSVRALIFETAAQTPEVGALEETLKWGQPAYLTPETKSGSTIRLGCPESGRVAIYTHCQTTLMSDFQTLFPDAFDYEGNRAVHLKTDKPIALEKLGFLISNALTYHHAKRAKQRP